MFKTFLFMPMAAVFQSGGTQLPPQEQGPEQRKVRIEIVTTENGETKRVTREFDANNEEQMQDAMRELGIMDHMVLSDGDRDVQIDIRRFGSDDEADEELRMLMAPLPPMPPGAPMPPLTQVKGYLGVSTASLTPEQAKRSKAPGGKGVYVTGVLEGTPAEALGLETGDVIVEVGGTAVADPAALGDAVGEHEPGDKVKVVWYRDGKKMSGSTELAESHSVAYTFRHEPGHGDLEWDMENYYGDVADMEPRAFLGVTPGEGEGEGASIGSVEDGTAAETMGIQKGDVITKVNDIDIADFDALSRTIRSMEPGEAVAVTLLRDGRTLTLNGELGERDFDHVISINPMREFRFEGFAPEDREALRREMNELRREMDQIRRDMGKDMRVETRIRIERKPLSAEEKELLRNNGVKSLDNELKLDDMRVFPNPSNGFFRIHFEAAEKGDLYVNVHDAKGVKVYEERITGFKGRYERTLDLSDKTAGTYYLVIEQGGKSVAEKLMKD